MTERPWAPCSFCGSNPATWEAFQRFGFRLPSCLHCQDRVPDVTALSRTAPVNPSGEPRRPVAKGGRLF